MWGNPKIQTITITVFPISLGVKALWLSENSTSFDVRQSVAEPQLTRCGILRNSFNLSNVPFPLSLKHVWFFATPMDCSIPGSSVLHYLPEFAQSYVHWVGDAIQPSYPLLPPFLPVLNLSQHQDLFQWVGSSHQVAKVLELQHQSFQWIQDWFTLRLTDLMSLLSKGVSSIFSSTTVWKASILPCLAFSVIQLSHLYLTTGKIIALTIWTSDGKVMSLLFNTLPTFVIAFLPRNKCLLILWLQLLSPVILEPKKRKYATISTFSPSICHEVIGPVAMILVLWMLSFKPAFSLSSFIFIKKLFSSSSLSAIRVVSPAYLRLMVFLLEILTPTCDSSSLAFHMMYSMYKLNKQGNNIQSIVLLPQFGISLLFHMSSSNCCFLTCIQVLQEASKVVLYSHLFKNFPQFAVIQ